jgi:flagellar motility protein MotE (MotC chaperone)
MMQFRLLPMVILASGLVLGLKISDLAFSPQKGWPPQAMAQETTPPAMPDQNQPAEAEPAPSPETQPPQEQTTSQSEGTIAIEGALETAEDRLLVTLGERRELLNKREEELNMRESLLEAAEKRLEQRVAELEALEAKINNSLTEQKQEREAEVKDLIVMYESMKAKNAAEIFNRLDTAILVEVAKRMNPRKLADVMGRMNPDNARNLTVALAGLSSLNEPVAQEAGPLPRIEGTEPLTGQPAGTQ